MSFKKVLIAVDSSEYSLNAAKKGIELAHELQAKVALLFVVDRSKAPGNIDAGIFPEEALIILKKEAEQTLEQLSSMFNYKDMIKFMPEGLPAEDIIKTAETWGADLIVMGTHGRTGLVHILLGSISEHVVRHSKIPVMVVSLK